jgi:hypothetical protein
MFVVRKGTGALRDIKKCRKEKDAIDNDTIRYTIGVWIIYVEEFVFSLNFGSLIERVTPYICLRKCFTILTYSYLASSETFAIVRKYSS